MGDGTDLNVTAAIGNRGATLVSQASPGLPVHWHDHNVHAYLVEGNHGLPRRGDRHPLQRRALDGTTWRSQRSFERACTRVHVGGALVPRSAKWGRLVRRFWPVFGILSASESGHFQRPPTATRVPSLPKGCAFLGLGPICTGCSRGDLGQNGGKPGGREARRRETRRHAGPVRLRARHPLFGRGISSPALSSHPRTTWHYVAQHLLPSRRSSSVPVPLRRTGSSGECTSSALLGPLGRFS